MFGIADYGAFVAASIFLTAPGPGDMALITSIRKGVFPVGFGVKLALSR
jgi:hypothetical protein